MPSYLADNNLIKLCVMRGVFSLINDHLMLKIHHWEKNMSHNTGQLFSLNRWSFNVESSLFLIVGLKCEEKQTDS